MNIKERPNHRLYIQTLRRMSPEARLRKRFPDLSEDAIKKICLERLNKCHNSNY